jgi:outer membrane immunogenic protein
MRRPRPIPRRPSSITGPVSISAAILGGAFAGDSSLQSSDARFLGGVQAGFDYQFAPNWVLGAEGSIRGCPAAQQQRRALSGRHPRDHGRTADQIGSVTGRLGYTWGPALVYAKGGYAWRDGNNIGMTIAGVPQPFTTSGNTKDGYTVGAGLEYLFAPNCRPRPSTSITISAIPPLRPVLPIPRRASATTSTPSGRVNYRFGWGGRYPPDIETAVRPSGKGRRKPAFLFSADVGVAAAGCGKIIFRNSTKLSR